MKIKKVSVNTHDMQLKEPYAIAGHVHESIKNTFIRIEDDDGNTGIGSCATRDDSEAVSYTHLTLPTILLV